MAFELSYKDKHGATHIACYAKILYMGIDYEHPKIVDGETVYSATVKMGMYHDQVTRNSGLPPVEIITFTDTELSKQDIRQYENTRKMGYLFLKQAVPIFSDAKDI